MSKTTPHRDAAEASLAEMRAQYDAMPPAFVMEDQHSRTLTLAVTEVVMRQLADVRDAGGKVEPFAHGLTHALANVIASFASYVTGHEQPAMADTVRNIAQVTLGRAIKQANAPKREGVAIVNPGGS